MCAYTEELGMFFQQIKFSTNYVLQSLEKEWTHYHRKMLLLLMLSLTNQHLNFQIKIV